MLGVRRCSRTATCGEYESGLGTAFFSVQNVPFFSVFLKNVPFFSVFFVEFLATYETQKNVLFFSVLF